MEADSSIFGFETDFAGTLRCIPMCVRLKLDQCGIKVSLKQWNKFPSVERHLLVNELRDSTAEITSYAAHVTRLIETYAGSRVETVEVDSSPEWANPHTIPSRVVNYALELGVTPPSEVKWRALSPLRRFALFKLTRPGHRNDNFIPAMREFGLLQ
jgi:hypothetical protein